ncbi:MAG: hypothetical protein PUC18_12730 [Prevotellaceae bacterium]|nr:hypothetical protein [Prevotellaceae bacterium]
MADPKLYISVFNDGTNDLYIKDVEARAEISDIKSSITGAMHYIGVSETAITDGATTGPWTIDGVEYIVSGTPTTGQALLESGMVADISHPFPLHTEQVVLLGRDLVYNKCNHFNNNGYMEMTITVDSVPVWVLSTTFETENEVVYLQSK